MYSFIYKIYFFLQRKRKKHREQAGNAEGILEKAIRFVLGYIEAYYNIFVVKSWRKHPSQKFGLNKKEREQKIIVSLTSFPGRIDTLWITIESILRQTVKPDKILLWLAESQFDGLESLPDSLLFLQKRGLTIRFCYDLRSHKKYFYTMQEHPDDLVVLLDDDMIYPFDTIEKLMKLHYKYPADICTITGQVIVPGKLPSQWRNPMLSEKLEHSDELQIFSGSGSLYPPHTVHKDAFDKKKIQDICPYADDLWLTYMGKRKNTKITALYPWRAFPVTIYGTSQGSLWEINAAQGQNDIQWESLINSPFNEVSENDKKDYPENVGNAGKASI